MINPVILSGGAGTRLWPLSRELYPKQLINLVGPGTMLQETMARLDGLDVGGATIVCNEQHRFLVAEQLREIGARTDRIILEPAGRNTAPAIAVAAYLAQSGETGERDPVLLVLPADHVIEDKNAFHLALAAGLRHAEAGRLVTFGVVPTKPETGYGYIKAAAKDPAGSEVAAFVEKPDRETAEVYLSSGDYFWNSGMFMFRAGVLLDELRAHAPGIAEHCRAAAAEIESDADFTRLNKQAFLDCPSDSIDYAVMEHTQKAFVVPFDAGWSDVGSWAALHEVSPHDPAGNVLHGDVIAEDTHDSYIHASSRLVATVGLRDCVVVETKDAVLVAHREAVQNVKSIVTRLKNAGRHETSRFEPKS